MAEEGLKVGVPGSDHSRAAYPRDLCEKAARPTMASAVAARAPLQCVVVADRGERLDALVAVLTAAESELAKAFSAERRRRHFVLGRFVLGHSCGGATDRLSISVLLGPQDEPLAQENGALRIVARTTSEAGWKTLRQSLCIGPSAPALPRLRR